MDTGKAYLGDIELFDTDIPVFIDPDGVVFYKSDCHIFVANGNTVAFPCVGLPKFVAVNDKDVTPTSLSTIKIGEEQVEGATVETNSGDIVYAIFDWENPTSSWMHWFSEIKQFGLNSETRKKNQIKNGYRAFRHMRITKPGALPKLDISNLTSLNTMFLDSTFNVDISNWNTSKITDMGGTFKNATKFNQDLSEWCVSRIGEMPPEFDKDSGFAGQTAKQPDWGTCPRGENVPNIDDILPDTYVTKDCHIFEANGSEVNLPCVQPIFVAVNGVAQPITLTTRTIEVPEIGEDGEVTTTSKEVETVAISANDKDIIHAIFDWDNNARRKNQNWFSDILQFGSRSEGGEAEGYTNPTPLASGRIPNQLKTGPYAFYYLGASPAAISTLDVSNLYNIAAMFRGANEFNQNINNWDTSNIKVMTSAFHQTAKFNKDLSAWDTSKVTEMAFMFAIANFNQDISGWNTSNVENMGNMFNQATRFNQDLSEWCVFNITSEPNSFAFGTTQWTKPKPQWGTCPRGEGFTSYTWPITIGGKTYEKEDAHIFVSNGIEINFPIPSSEKPIFVGVNGETRDPITVTRTIEREEIGEDGVTTTTTEEIQVASLEEIANGDIIEAIFDWDNISATWQHWFSDILQFGLNSVTGERNQLKSAYRAFRKMRTTPIAIENLDISNHSSLEAMFWESDYNGNIVDWDTSNVIKMDLMFKDTTKFNQDLSGWCVRSTSHNLFDEGATAWTLPNSRPIWGTCLRNEDVPNIDGILPDPYVTKDCHVFISNGRQFSSASWFAMQENSMPIFVAVNGVKVSSMSDLKDGDIIHAIFDWNNRSDYYRYKQNWFTDILQIGLNSETGKRRQVKNGQNAFYYMSFVNSEILSTLDVSNITDMTSMFEYAGGFNQNIGDWDTSKVKTMKSMFASAGEFNQNINYWNVSSVINMSNMFYYAVKFNSPLRSWNTSNVTNMNSMFNHAESFNGLVSNWNTSKVMDMSYMFQGAKAFNEDVSNWDTSNVTNMSYMFKNAIKFNCYDQRALGWDTSNVTLMQSMFDGATDFNASIGTWKIPKVSNMTSMFSGAKSFNQNISRSPIYIPGYEPSWNTQGVGSMNGMFSGATSFNQDLSNWCVPLHSEEPLNFSYGAYLWTEPKPVWGTCPAVTYEEDGS